MASKPIYTVTVTFGIAGWRGRWKGTELDMEPQVTIICEADSKEYAQLVYERLSCEAQADGRQRKAP